MTTLTPDELKLANKWNEFVKSLIACQEAWKEFVNLRQSVTVRVNALPPELGKFFGLATSRSNFSVGVGRIVDYVRKYGSVQDLLAKLPEQQASRRK